MVKSRRYGHAREKTVPPSPCPDTDVKPMVYTGLFPIDADQYPALRCARQAHAQRSGTCLRTRDESGARLRVSRQSFLGLLHMEVIRRLEREFRLDLIATAPSVSITPTSLMARK